jgi:RNA polymerase sigma-70 factor (ECF subfamily)
MADRSFDSLLAGLRRGSDEAAAQVVRQYTMRLIDIARRQISSKLARRVDPEDVVQSAYRSLFLRIHQGQFELGSGDDLWKLLLSITLNKLRRQAQFHSAARRSIEKEQSDSGGAAASAEPASLEPSPDEAAALVDELEGFFKELSDSERPVIELRLQGASTADIAKQLNCSERTVRRILERVTDRLDRRAAETPSP